MLQYIVYTRDTKRWTTSIVELLSQKQKMASPHVFHFSHPHPLRCTTLPSTPNIVTCFGCNIKVNYGEDYYQCKTCAFSLHHVCYNMPLITNHPSHPTHDLHLLVAPSSKATLNCVACGHRVTAFSYHCAQCTSFFHALCLALPVSLAITCHPHKIKLEFSPPYDFFCDLCNKPCNFNHRWLYRCSMCEFDTHISCALENLEPRLFQSPSFPQSSPLLRQQVEHTKLSAGVGDSFKGYEFGIMSLVAEQIGGENFDSKTDGWDKRLYSSSPWKKYNRGESEKMKNVELELQEKKLSPAEVLSKLEERTPLRDKWTPLSDHSPFSYQYSDSCFSIDLAKSYSAHARRSDQITRNVVSKEPFVPVNNKMNADSDVGKSSQRVTMKNPNESHAKRSVQDQTIAMSETVSSNNLYSSSFSSCDIIFCLICGFSILTFHICSWEYWSSVKYYHKRK